MKKLTFTKIQTGVTLFMVLLLTVFFSLQQLPRGGFVARADAPEPKRFSLVEMNRDCNFTVPRLTEHKTIVYLERIEFTPSEAMAAALVDGEFSRFTIYNEADEWAKMRLTYGIIDGVHTFTGPISWEWREFYNDELWRYEFYVTRPNGVQLDFVLENNFVQNVVGYYALPDTYYDSVDGLNDMIEDPVTRELVINGYREIVGAAVNGEEPAAYVDYYQADYGDGDVVFPSNADAPYSSSVLNSKSGWLKALVIGCAVVGTLALAAIGAAIGIVGGPVGIIIGAAAGFAVGAMASVAVITAFFSDVFADDSTPALTTEEEAHLIADNIEFSPDGDESSASTIIALNFTDEGGTHPVSDNAGRRIYYNKVTRLVGNSSYCALDYLDLSLLKFDLTAKSITSVKGNRMTVSLLVDDPEKPNHQTLDGYYVLINEGYQPAISFVNQDEFRKIIEDSNKQLSLLFDLKSYMVSLQDVAAQNKALIEAAQKNQALDNIAGTIGKWFGCDNFNWSQLWKWLLIIVGVILLIIFFPFVLQLLGLLFKGIKAVIAGIIAFFKAIGRGVKKLFTRRE
jgi:hypothetical protein